MSRARRFLAPPPSRITIAAPSFPKYTRRPGPKSIRDSNTPPPTPFALEKSPCSIRARVVRTPRPDHRGRRATVRRGSSAEADVLSECDRPLPWSHIRYHYATARRPFASPTGSKRRRSATREGQPERGHLLAVAHEQDLADQHRVVPGGRMLPLGSPLCSQSRVPSAGARLVERAPRSSRT